MTQRHEIFITAPDADALAVMLGTRRRAQPFAADPSDVLADLLLGARLVPAARMPADRVALGTAVTYVEEPHGVQRTVTLVMPEEANASAGRISVLSPIGLSLIGRRRGSVVKPPMPNGRDLRIRIVDTVARAAAEGIQDGVGVQNVV